MNTSNTLHTASACFSKKFSTNNFNDSHNDVPLRKNGNACGEDDFFISQSGDIHLMTVADGVGSWTNMGVDPKIFTHALLSSINLRFKSLTTTILAQHDKRQRSFLLNIISDAYNDVLTTKKFIKYGSCTVVSLSLNLKTLHLNSYNLGES